MATTGDVTRVGGGAAAAAAAASLTPSTGLPVIPAPEGSFKELSQDVLGQICRCLGPIEALGLLSTASKGMRDRVVELIPAHDFSCSSDLMRRACGKRTMPPNIQRVIITGLRYTEAVDSESLGEAFYSALERNHAAIITEMLRNRVLEKISLEHIRRALDIALGHTHEEVVNAILSHARVVKIPATGWCGLGSTLVMAAARGHLAVVNAIMAHARFAEIPATGWCGLGSTLVIAATGGHLAVVNAIMAQARAAEISRDDLIRAYRMAGTREIADAIYSRLGWRTKILIGMGIH